MYLGKIMEIGETNALYAAPHHPYTKALLSAVPQPDPRTEKTRERIILSGDLPSPMKAKDKCRIDIPELLQVGNSQVACHFPEE
jgi:oligopeptide/dipeptide ABC transporter ATP-binding protein